MVQYFGRISEKKKANLGDIFLLLSWNNSSTKCRKIEFI